EDPSHHPREIRWRAGGAGHHRRLRRRAARHGGGRLRAVPDAGGIPPAHAAGAGGHRPVLEVLRQAASRRAAGSALLISAGDRAAAPRNPSEVTVLRPELGATSPRLARDYFRELLRDSQPHPGLSAERERWLRGCRVEGREERLFEFEMLLRGIERYFKLHNLPIDSVARPVVTRDFA